MNEGDNARIFDARCMRKVLGSKPYAIDDVAFVGAQPDRSEGNVSIGTFGAGVGDDPRNLMAPLGPAIDQPPAIAPITMNGSSPWTTRSGSSASGSSCDRSSSQA
jgi:hypothetical protein